MTLVVETPDTRAPERDYVLGVLLGDFLGLSWRPVPSERRDIRITLEGEPGEIHLPDTLFSVPDADWLTQVSMPRRPLPRWDTRDLANDITLVESIVPVIYGDGDPAARREGETVTLPVDIFGSAFFMLSRYEEMVTPDRDEHDRFPAWTSLAYQEGFLERPIIDEYVEILWAAINRLWPGLKRRPRQACTRVSHDVDRPSRYSFGPFRRFVRSVAGDVVKRRDLASLLRGPVARYGSRNTLHSSDPFNTFDWLMDVSEANGLQSAFYFIPGKTYPPHDPLYDLEDARILNLIRRIAERGHEVGLHPGYNTYRDPETLAAQAERVRAVSEREGVRQSDWGGRMHYLQWDARVTPDAWENAGMAYDSTLGYADHTGFRCGTSHDFPLYSWSIRRRLTVTERPLIAMDGSLLAGKYMGLTEPEDVIIHLRKLRSQCHLMNGTFNLLWHNSEFLESNNKQIYERVFEAMCV